MKMSRCNCWHKIDKKEKKKKISKAGTHITLSCHTHTRSLKHNDAVHGLLLTHKA